MGDAPDPPPVDAPAAPKALYSIFAPRSALAPSSTSSAAAASTSTAAPIPPSKKEKGKDKSPDAETETLSLVEDSGESAGEERPSKRRKRSVTAATKSKGTAKGKGKKRVRKDDTDEDEYVGDSSDGDDDVRVVAGRVTRASKGKGKTAARVQERGKKASASSKKAARTTKGKKRAPSPSSTASSSASATDSEDNDGDTGTVTSGRDGSIVLDLTQESPRRRRAKRKNGDPTKGTASAARAGPAPFTAFSKEAIERREKRRLREPVPARWPTREEHEGRLLDDSSSSTAVDEVARAEAEAKSAWEGTRWVRGDGKGKGKALQQEDDDGETTDYLRRFQAALDFPAIATASSSRSAPPRPAGLPRFVRRPLEAVPSLVPAFPSHPLLERLAAPLRSPSSYPSAFTRSGDPSRLPNEDDTKLWVAKYAPQSADEVLGDVSGQSARWLREWLEELKVESAAADAKSKKRRRPIARGLDKSLQKKKKKRKPKGLDDFLASSDEDDDDNLALPSSSFDSYADDFSDEFDDDASATSRRAGGASSVFPSLTNLILLHGPHGSGKSSTVHAVAHELGYEVFEVFPGLGRRGAKDLERYVGDVGKNHLVLKGAGGASGSPRKGALAAMFGKQAKKAEEADEGKGKGKERASEEEADEKELKEPKQSLILVDEVDVLFRHEEDFWQGLAHLAKDSRRPIVMTCTDDSRIPFHELNVQQIVHHQSAPPVSYLSFAAPPASLIVPYLQLVALREGHVNAPATLSTLYESFSRSRPYPPWMLQQQAPLGGRGERPIPHPLAKAPLPSDDLRKALMQLQFECQWGIGGPGSGVGRTSKAKGHENGSQTETRWSEGTLRVPPEPDEAVAPHANGDAVSLNADDAFDRAVRAADALSYADAHVARRVSVLIEHDETGRFTTVADAEDTFPVLEYIPPRDRHLLPFLGAEPVLEDALHTLAHEIWPGALCFALREDERLESERADFSFRLWQLFHSGGANSLIRPPAPILPHPSVAVDYRSAARSITLADDANMAAWSRPAASAASDDGHTSESSALGSAASLAAGPAGAGGGGGAARMRKSTRLKVQAGQPLYERVLPWASSVEADWLRQSGFGEGP
ncbi:uncharacterized protein JCM10292_003938 [Rhodotorula paludigena]|uniref:uncharacterized protein n=1 Tax=Rhodotorula paludigena TaxID=86838 RepID=UPI00316C15E5